MTSPDKRRFVESGIQLLRKPTPKGKSKDTSDSATSLARQIFRPDDWHSQLVDRALPVLAVKMAESGAAFLMGMGVDVRRKSVEGTKHLPGGHSQLSHGRGGWSKTLEVVKEGTGFSEEQIKDALTGDVSPSNPGRAKVRAKIIGAIYASGTQMDDAINDVLDAEAPAVRKGKLNEIVYGKLKNTAVKELADLPKFDLDILSGVEARGVPVGGEATCQMATRKVTGGVGTRSGSWRHEVGHAIRSSWGGDSPSSSRVMTRAASKRYDEVKDKVKEKPIGKKKKMSHEWYETEYGVAGRRSVDNWEENAAEHYRLYHREVYRDRKEGGGGKHLAQYRKRHPEWAKMWDAHYTAAMLGQKL